MFPRHSWGFRHGGFLVRCLVWPSQTASGEWISSVCSLVRLHWTKQTDRYKTNPYDCLRGGGEWVPVTILGGNQQRRYLHAAAGWGMPGGRRGSGHAGVPKLVHHCRGSEDVRTSAHGQAGRIRHADAGKVFNRGWPGQHSRLLTFTALALTLQRPR